MSTFIKIWQAHQALRDATCRQTAWPDGWTTVRTWRYLCYGTEYWTPCFGEAAVRDTQLLCKCLNGELPLLKTVERKPAKIISNKWEIFMRIFLSPSRQMLTVISKRHDRFLPHSFYLLTFYELWSWERVNTLRNEHAVGTMSFPELPPPSLKGKSVSCAAHTNGANRTVSRLFWFCVI
jgi:hypothetical protein